MPRQGEVGSPSRQLMAREDLNRVWVLRKVLAPLSATEGMELLLDKMGKSKSNADFLSWMQRG